MFKISKIVDFHDYIWNQNEKCIQIRINMSGIVLIIHEKTLKYDQFEKAKQVFFSKTNERVVSVNRCQLNIVKAFKIFGLQPVCNWYLG